MKDPREKKSTGITMGNFSLSEFGNRDNNPESAVGSLIRVQVRNLISFKSSCLVCNRIFEVEA